MIPEEWLPIKGYEGLYEVSNRGKIKSLARKVSYHNGNSRNVPERLLTPVKNKKGYLNVFLYKSGKATQYRVHRIVAEAFLVNNENKPQINHINEIRDDNRISNLEWATSKENNNHGSRNSKISKARSKVVEGKSIITGEVLRYEKVRDVVFDGFNYGAVASCCRGELTSHKGFTWKYI
ncbi:NUMOD4 motif family protein [Enterococcus phage VD13]|uniref:HNH homing endonuclease n=1 Tax=Enterococcus phage VD13 TaxID=1458851 RepID=X2KXT0_9CAUD|nr:NUMOD4 motif family protein [Enterococcus phage VD13]YP_009592516.1 HNH endonuclease [Enterococcus phage VD13]AHL19660.1 HNH homing endonuclease [Enterococcus phage VD13]AHN83162.1 NUMOD4 motif family protein [Enterococcus phage VD13]